MNPPKGGLLRLKVLYIIAHLHFLGKVGQKLSFASEMFSFIEFKPCTHAVKNTPWKQLLSRESKLDVGQAYVEGQHIGIKLPIQEAFDPQKPPSSCAKPT